MKEGLQITTVASGYYPYVRVGWLRHVGGDEWEMVGARIVLRFNYRQGLAYLAKNGPQRDTELQDKSDEPEPHHRLRVDRSIACDEKAWATECPKPEGWAER